VRRQRICEDGKLQMFLRLEPSAAELQVHELDRQNGVRHHFGLIDVHRFAVPP
jgi:hypothetical protein